MIISYAQQFEDVLLRRLFPHNHGFYIDVGANDPVECSVTKLFSDSGWTGINIEPGAIFERLKFGRPRDVNLRVAVSDRSGEMTFYEFPDAHGLSTLDAKQAAEHQQRGFRFIERRIPVMTLAEICQQYVSGPIDFLSIDVEGHEREVLAGADFQRYRPICVMIESTRPCSPIPTHQQWESLILQADYRFATFDGLNSYYIRSENAELIVKLQNSVNVFDGDDLEPPLRFKDLSERLRKFVLYSTEQKKLLNRLQEHVAWLEPQVEHWRQTAQQLQHREAIWETEKLQFQQECERLRKLAEEAQQLAHAEAIRREVAESLVNGLQKTLEAMRQRSSASAA